MNLYRIDIFSSTIKIIEIKLVVYALYLLIKGSMEFCYNHKKRKMSMTDCISYMMAKSLGIKFLTGDKEFEDMDNVEFVK